MDPRVPAIAEQLLLIERELRRLNWWSDEAPDEQALGSQAPFCVDTLAFEQWLQWVFLPRMKVLVEQGEGIPRSSGLLPMAQVAFRHDLQRAFELIQVLEAFDRLVSGEGLAG